MIKVEKFVVNPLQENAFVVYDETGECILVDPGFYFEVERREIKEFFCDHRLTPVMIANTHGHFDHVMGVEFIRNEYKVPFIMHAEDEFWIDRVTEQAEMFGFEMEPVRAPDAFFGEGEQLRFGHSRLEILHIPGHSPGHVVFYSRQDQILLAGDVLFYGGIGRTDLPGGDSGALISGIKNRLFQLPGETKVFCGHGPETSLDFEKSSNPFLT